MAPASRPGPVQVPIRNMRFLTTHGPTGATLNTFIAELKKYGVTTIVRVCGATYDTALVEKEGIQVLDWPFGDGSSPSNQIVDDGLSLVNVRFREEPGCCIAVHCVAGLGRTPVLVALALTEGGMKNEDAVQFIRPSDAELLTASNFWIWRNAVPKCGCATKTPVVIGTTVAFNKTWLPDAVALEMELETGLPCGKSDLVSKPKSTPFRKLKTRLSAARRERSSPVCHKQLLISGLRRGSCVVDGHCS
ncbi:LOW QUALITY PROTEIN: protein tyrosine phosphatase type IVA 1-like [Canis lupus familiaris]|uniref:LOW QUALITY PROTEIN: protein tyrosine phosphatase type IVA 1-like n=1 Tax=Canis lupus familiaris TaxID=9615 RepID=UPI0015F14C95|nr:LOW QUALITY PROTEIN: protein tyrosine phosphatase type IVA 1-like [Canis lupus familiaris]XP_038312427.1 LOW QUALITY PROTEIN: protein tyrosine phosphatase type IVA 1-like [Canis lupus familiaris]XP_038424294.1 LOW QUALITY PROTEIN: protein tyrosine phosphatase type IVA 1-like [Canis lupus familiaris]